MSRLFFNEDQLGILRSIVVGRICIGFLLNQHGLNSILKSQTGGCDNSIGTIHGDINGLIRQRKAVAIHHKFVTVRDALCTVCNGNDIHAVQALNYGSIGNLNDTILKGILTLGGDNGEFLHIGLGGSLKQGKFLCGDGLLGLEGSIGQSKPPLLQGNLNVIGVCNLCGL